MAPNNKPLETPPPDSSKIRVLTLNGSLKPPDEFSNTQELAMQVIDEMGSKVTGEVVRLSAYDKILPGVGHNMGKGDQWPELAKKIRAADIVIFATPIWWGHRSSLLQRVIERMDSFDEHFRKTGVSLLKGKVAGIIVTGSEDGAQAIVSGLMSTLSWMGFTIPPQAAVYWVGEVGISPALDTQRRRQNVGVRLMVEQMAENLVRVWSQIQK